MGGGVALPDYDGDGILDIFLVNGGKLVDPVRLPADLYPTGSLASVSGLSGAGAGIGTILATLALVTLVRSANLR